MITRIVKMYFKPEQTENFKLLFEEVKDLIAACEGCEGVKLVQDILVPEIFFTISYWRTLENLESYRNSDLFTATWSRTKAMFAGRPEAWSTIAVDSQQSSVDSGNTTE